MSSIVDSTGQPVRPSLDEDQLLKVLQGFRVRMDAANAQLIHLGLLIEFLYEAVGKADITIDMEEFPTWAQSRYEEIQKEAKEALANGLMDDFKEQANQALSEVNLSDD